MPFKVFYSWQSDLDPRTTRDLIREALNDALSKAGRDLSLEEAPRLDQDTKGVAGIPDIAQTILQKIENCDVFVPDLTFVGASSDGTKIPNPNVLYELGYAMHAKGESHIVAVMNTDYGKPATLPFHLVHRRWPIKYSLASGTSSESLRTTRATLSDDLRKAIGLVLETLLSGEQVTSSTVMITYLINEPTFGHYSSGEGTDFHLFMRIINNGDQTIEVRSIRIARLDGTDLQVAHGLTHYEPYKRLTEFVLKPNDHIRLSAIGRSTERIMDDDDLEVKVTILDDQERPLASKVLVIPPRTRATT